ncbi:ribosomal-protein-alanine N-acetyltransferase [Lipingzhangella halophila]|uniref:Ribosomal-protein-alanine N-acetyltransferase n=1 Tax=Lipingzhangella halophila TaxID=1783352 RepID=A0A7W7W1H2_9ACTN|nr:GNAT family protein [Lipingzhangella halophila]MBB4929685.1 ribosomal-protein-alanine N-acetyltransferase [Lipingzhangella halophila]
MSRRIGWPVTLNEGPVGLRPLRLRDAGPLRAARVRNAEWLRPWEPTHPEMPLSSSSIAPYIAMIQAVRREARQGIAMPWTVTYEGAFAGQLTVGAIVWGSARSAQVGYWIDSAYAGRGITPTAVAMAVDYCFFTVGLHRIEANIRPENQASRRVAEKLGFREEGVRKRQLHIDGAWRDHIGYALTVEDLPEGLLARWRRAHSEGRDLPPGGTSASGGTPGSSGSQPGWS